MHAVVQSLSPGVSGHRPAATMITTLYEVIQAVQEEVSPGDEGLVAEVVAGLFNSGRIRFAAHPAGSDVDRA